MTFPPADSYQPQIINISKKLKDLLACRVVLAENHQYPGTIQKLFCLQNWLSRKSPISRKYSKTFSPAELSQPKIINIREQFKNFFACRIGLATNHQYPGNIQRLFRLQSCLSRKSSISGNNSKTFLPVELAQPQITNIPEIFEDFFAGRIVLAANHQYPGKIRRLFRRQNCLSRKSSISRKDSKTFSPAELSQPQIIGLPKYSKTFSRAELSQPQIIGFPKYSKTFSPAELSQQQIINIPEIFEDFFAGRIVLAANHRFPEIFKEFFASRIVLAANHRFPEIFKDFFACKVVLAENHQYPGTFQKFFCLQNWLSRKSPISRKYSKTFPPAELSQPKIMNIRELFKNFFACRIGLAANHQYPGNIQ